MPFNQDSGLVYSEEVYRASPNRTDWIFKARGSIKEIEKHRSPGPGCSSLRDMALRKACVSTKYMDSETLNGIDWQIAQQLWKTIRAHEVDSLHAWKVFATAYPHVADPSIQRRCQRITDPNMTLAEYINPLVSPSLQWITFLTLSNITCSRADLIGIAKLGNIGALTIGKGVTTPDFGLDDSIVRAWAVAATETGAFRTLRVLACSNQYGITPRIFDHIIRLPVLKLFLVDACERIPGSEHVDWGYQAGKDFGRKLLASKGGSSGLWDSFIRSCFFQRAKGSKPKSESGGVEAQDSKPVIHFFLGVSPWFAAFEHIENMEMRCFYRKKTLLEPAQQLPTVFQRSSVGPQSGQPARKRVMRTPRRAPLGNFMTEFGI